MYYYQDIKNELVNKVGIQANDIFDYQDAALKDVFEDYFNFCQENLSERCPCYSIQPAKFYFINNTTVNACASHPNEYYIIGVNSGTMVSLNGLFKSHFLMLQGIMLFIFYHELAHLIQKSPTLVLGLSEKHNITDKSIYSIQRHVLEYDADLNGANKLCHHLIDYWKSLENGLKTQARFQELISHGVASVFIYFMFLNGDKDIYIKESCHPHNLVRILYIIDCFLHVVNDEANLPNGIKIDKQLTIRETFEISDKLFKASSNDNHIKNLTQVLDKNGDSIENYINELSFVSNTCLHLVKNRHLL